MAIKDQLMGLVQEDREVAIREAQVKFEMAHSRPGVNLIDYKGFDQQVWDVCSPEQQAKSERALARAFTRLGDIISKLSEL